MGGKNRLRSAITLAALVAFLVPLGSAQAATFSNPAPITMSFIASAATPYPSTVSVAGVADVADVNVTLHGLSMATPSALDVQLVGPQGQSVVLMSDLPSGSTGSSPACQMGASNVTLTFDDAAAGPLPGGVALASGTYQPLDNDTPTCNNPQTNDNYPNPADDPPNGTKLADFNGTSPAGVWSLFVNDSQDISGSISGGWSLQVSPSNQFAFGKLKKHKHKGTASLSLDVPGPGTLTLGGKGVKAQRPRSGERITAARAVSAAGTVTLPIKAKGKAKRKLKKTGKAKLKVNVTYTPTGGQPNTVPKRVKLIKKG